MSQSPPGVPLLPWGLCVCKHVHSLCWDWAAVISRNAQELLESSWKAPASILPAVVWWVPVTAALQMVNAPVETPARYVPLLVQFC